MKQARIASAWLTAAVLLSGCGGGGSASSAGAYGPSLNAVPAPAMLRAAGKYPPTVFVSDLSGAVTFFPANIHEKNPPALGSIAQGITRADGLAVDRSNTLYVTNGSWPPSIVEYKRGTSTPFKTITQGLYTPGMLAVDASRDIYVVDGQNGGVILVYPAGAGSPSRTIAVPKQSSHSEPGGITFDSQGNLLVATFDVEHRTAAVYRIAPGSSQAINLNLQGLPGNALGTDKAGDIYVGGDEGNIAVFAAGSKTPTRSVSGGNGGFYSDFAVTANGTIYWPNYDLGEMFEFAPGASTPTSVFSSGGGVDAAVATW